MLSALVAECVCCRVGGFLIALDTLSSSESIGY